ncbi:hypothetical protein ACOMHN_016971 [Nucella lapillus]
MVNCIKSGREVKEGQKRYVTNIRGSEKFRVLFHFHTWLSLYQSFRSLDIHGELSLEGRGVGHYPRVGVSLSLAPRLSNYCRQ